MGANHNKSYVNWRNSRVAGEKIKSCVVFFAGKCSETNHFRKQKVFFLIRNDNGNGRGRIRSFRERICLLFLIGAKLPEPTVQKPFTSSIINKPVFLDIV